MKCGRCGSRFPYAEVYVFHDERVGSGYWTYLCKGCYLEERSDVNSNGYYELTITERIGVTTGLTSLNWKIKEKIYDIQYWYKKKVKKEDDSVEIGIFEKEL